MPKRTTVILDDDVYEKIVRESIKRYGTTRALSKIINDLLRKSLSYKEDLVRLIYSEKTVHISEEDFEIFRRELEKRFVSR